MIRLSVCVCVPFIRHPICSPMYIELMLLVFYLLLSLSSSTSSSSNVFFFADVAVVVLRSLSLSLTYSLASPIFTSPFIVSKLILRRSHVQIWQQRIEPVSIWIVYGCCCCYFCCCCCCCYFLHFSLQFTKTTLPTKYKLKPMKKL